MMKTDFDVVIHDTVSGEISEDAARKPMGGSEYALVQLSRELAARGFTSATRSRGGWHRSSSNTPSPYFRDRPISCKTLIISRYSTIPSDITYERVVVAATDMPGGEGGGSYKHLDLLPRDLKARAPATFVFVSKWHASLFPSHWDKKVIYPMIDAAVYVSSREARFPGRYVYASAAMKGLTETLKWWKTLCEEFPKEMKGRELHVATNWDDPPKGAFDDVPHVQWHGRLRPQLTQQLLSRAEGLFYVNVFPETFGAVAAVAQAAGARVHALCLHDIGGLGETNLHGMVTNSKETFVSNFLRPSWDDVKFETIDFRPEWIMSQWLDVLGLHTMPSSVSTVDFREVQGTPLTSEPDPVKEFFKSFKKDRGLMHDPPNKDFPTLPSTKPTVGLIIIAKNEADVLPRAIASGRGIINTFTVVLDQTNKDDMLTWTQRSSGAIDTQGHFYMARTPFGGHAAARNEAVNMALELNTTDFVLMLDADDTLEGSLPPEGLDRTVDGYELEILDGNTHHNRLHIFNPRKGFKYVRRAHEYLEAPPGAVIKKLPGIYIRRGEGGAARRTPESTKAKFLHDIELLEEDLKEFGDARSVFYLAQSYNDVGRAALSLGQYADGHFENSLDRYIERIRMGGWVEEVFVSHMRAGGLYDHLKKPFEAKAHYLAAMETVWARATEPVAALANLYNREGKHDMTAWVCELHDLKLSQLSVIVPPQGLFVDVDAYYWKLKLELSLAVWHLNHKSRSAQLTQELLDSPNTPDVTKVILRQNLENCK